MTKTEWKQDEKKRVAINSESTTVLIAFDLHSRKKLWRKRRQRKPLLYECEVVKFS